VVRPNRAKAASQYVDIGLRLLLAEDFFLYVLNEANDRVYFYQTELWYEWLEVAEHPSDERATVADLIPYAHKYRPSPLAKMECDHCVARTPEEHMTGEDWAACHA
jgi:hypothetical protein